MPDGSVVFDGVWKKFRRGERHDSLRDLIPSLVKRAFSSSHGQELRREEFWALRDVSFEVKAGEALGIIGPNGAGKSTTLKLLTRILRPTQGACQVKGRTGALIEVSAGFHADLTGRENVFLQGAILGMRQSEVVQKFDAIVDFAGVGEFIDTPVKRYSSGMNARLGFAIAVNLDPDVLIIDEVLSVGDMAFQQRCVQHMRDFKKRGVAIVFVSHNLHAVTELCDRAVHLNKAVQCIGPASVVVDSYVKSPSATVRKESSGEAAVRSATLTNSAGQPVERVEPGAGLVLQVEYAIAPSMTEVSFGLSLHRSTDDLIVYYAHFTAAELGIAGPAAAARAGEPMMIVRVDYHLKANVSRGHYHFGCSVFHTATQRYLHGIKPAAQLVVHEVRTWSGIADLGVSAVMHTLVESPVEP